MANQFVRRDNDNITIVSEQAEGCANLEHSNPFPLIIKCFPEDITETKYLAGLSVYSKNMCSCDSKSQKNGTAKKLQ